MRFLAIDPGQRRTGLALGDDVTGIVTPLEVLVTSSVSELHRMIGRVVEAQGPSALVVGLPLNMDGSEGPAAKNARVFGDGLAASLGLPVYYADERLTSVAADQQMAGSGLTHKRKKERRDALAAAALLRGFLATRHNTLADHDTTP